MAIFQQPPGRPGESCMPQPPESEAEVALRTGKVVSFTGKPALITDAGAFEARGSGKPAIQPDVVAELEWLSSRARCGDVVGLIYAAAHADRSTSNRYVGTFGYGALGALTTVLHRVAQVLNDEKY